MLTRRTAIASIGASFGAMALPACSRAGGPIPAGLTLKQSFASLRDFAKSQVDAGVTPGLAVGMSGLGFRKSAYIGMADMSRGVPVGPSSQFRIASVTKPIVAVAALQMSEAGKIDLDARLSTFFPKFPRAEEVTLKQLLQHTSGLANWWNRLPDEAPEDFMNREDALDWLARMHDPYLFAPGALRDYSNSGYVVLGKVLEQAEGRKLNEVLAYYVFDRVGADATSFEQSAQAEDWVTGYQSSWQGFEKAPLVAPPYAAGGLRSTLHDQLAIADAVFLGPLLEPASKAAMLTHARVTDGRRVQDAMYVAPGQEAQPLPSDTSELGYGLGINIWVQLGERFYSHAGSIDGFSSYLIHAPRTGISVSVLSNAMQSTADINEYVRSLLRALPDNVIAHA